jgi:hypothetical protein
MAAKHKKDKRRFRRMPVLAVVRYAPRQFGSNVPPDLWEGKTLDISRSGAALDLPHILRCGGMVELSLIKSDPPRCVSVVGEVIRCDRIPGGDTTDADGSARARYLVGVNFTRTLEIEELSVLRETHRLDSTEVESRQHKQASSSADAG